MLKPKSIVDFGCGKGNLLDEVGKKLSLKKTTKYDPAIPLFSREIEGSHDLLINIDVLEHVPENEIDDLLLKMKKVADNYLSLNNVMLSTVFKTCLFSHSLREFLH